MASRPDSGPDCLEQPLGRFLDLVASREPAPGGVASAAVTVALAAALTAMAARFSTGHLADADELAGRADGLRGEVVVLARADAAAYGRVLDAHRTSRDDKEARRREIREALTEAADVPLSIAGIGAEVAGISARLAEEGNPNLRGDAITAAVLAGGARGGYARRDQHLGWRGRRREAIPRGGASRHGRRAGRRRWHRGAGRGLEGGRPRDGGRGWCCGKRYNIWGRASAGRERIVR